MAIDSISGADLHHVEQGSGRAIVFLPGLGAGGAMFGPQAEAFRATHRVVRPDLRGNGRSPRLRGPIGTILDHQCDDLAALLDRLNIARAAVVGVSYGGAVAFRFALRHPGRVAALVAADTFADLHRRRPMEALLWLGSYATLPAYYLPRPLLKGVGRLLLRRRPVARDLVSAMVDGFRPTEAVWQSVAMCRADDRRQLGRVNGPALGIVGDGTRTGVRMMERAMAAIPGARLEVIADSFDPSNLWQPEAFNRLLAGFLREVGW